MEMKQNVSESADNSFIQTKIFLDSSTQTKKKIFSDSSTRTRHFHDQILAVVFSWPIVSSAKVGHGNETKCFGISRQFFHPNKNIFRFLDPNKKKIIFRFLDLNKKKYIFWIP